MKHIVKHLLKLSLACVILGAFKLVWVFAFANVDDVESRLGYLARRLEHETPGPNVTTQEWYVGSLSMTSLAAANLAFAQPETRERRLALVERLADRALEPGTRRFDTRIWGSDALETLAGDEGHLGYLGHLALVLGAECALGGHRHDPLRRRIESAMERRWAQAPNGLVETYPRLSWIPDNAAALAGAAMSARCDGRPAPEVARRWPVDPHTGLFAFTPRVGSRASGAGFVALYLPFADPSLAAEQLEKARRVFGAEHLGFAAWREYPRGVAGKGDVDSGPLIFGLSPAGTGFAIGGLARMHAPELKGMLRTAEAAGFTVPFGGNHYLVAPLVGEASVLAGRTAVPWRWPAATGSQRVLAGP